MNESSMTAPSIPEHQVEGEETKPRPTEALNTRSSGLETREPASPHRQKLSSFQLHWRKRPFGNWRHVNTKSVHPSGVAKESSEKMQSSHRSARIIHPERQQQNIHKLKPGKSDQIEENSYRTYRNRRVVLCSSVAVCVYVCAGILLGTVIEGWNALDALYFSVVTLTTVGYGDLQPVTYVGRIYCAIYVIVGVVMITLALGVVGEYVMDKLDGDDEAYRNYDPKKFWAGARWKLLFSFVSILVVLVVGILFFIFAPSGSFKFLSSNSTTGSIYGNENLADAFYFVVVTIGTVGYGDITPATVEAKIFCCVWICLGYIIVVRGIGSSLDIYLEAKQREIRSKILQRSFVLEDLFKADDDGSGSVTEAEFIIYKIGQMELVSREEIRVIADQFKVLDVDGSGLLTKEECISANIPTEANDVCD